MKKKNETTTHTIERLQKDVVEMQEKLRAIRFGGAGSRSRNVREGRNMRRDVARSLTEMRARDMATTKVAKTAKTA
jgi:ribosomal protein L29